MKKFSQYLLLIALSFTSMLSFAYDPKDSYEVSLQKLQKTDCSVSPAECRYYAALEYLAFAKACQLAFEYKLKTVTTQKDLDTINEWINKWKAIEAPKMHEAVLSSKNSFKERLIQDTTEYLKKGTSTDMGIECGRLALIKENGIPEEMSDLIRATINYKQWYAPIMKKRGLVYLDKDGNRIEP